MLARDAALQKAILDYEAVTEPARETYRNALQQAQQTYKEAMNAAFCVYKETTAPAERILDAAKEEYKAAKKKAEET